MNLLQPPDNYGLTTADYRDILVETDNGDYEVNDWEAEFISSTIELQSFSEGQKKVIRGFDLKYLQKK